MILIISHEKDEHSREVQRMLEQKGHPYELLDLSCFPVEAHLSINYNSDRYSNTVLQHQNKIFEFNNYRSLWRRRPQPFTLHKEINGQVEITFTHGECHSAINGMWLLPEARWINDPVNDEVAARKVYQLKVAAELGLPIPRTCITSNPEQA